MPTTFSIVVDTVAVPPRPPLGRAHTSQCDEGLPNSTRKSASTGEASSAAMSTCDVYPVYPGIARVRNTFVELLPGRDPSLEEFFEERKCHSGPASCGQSNRECKDDEEVPLASSRTTCCSASVGSVTASTPPQFSDTEDVTEVTPRLSDEGPCAARCMPASRAFQKTMSEYRSGLRSLPTQQAAATSYASPMVDAMSQRTALPPGPLHNMPSHSSVCSPTGCQHDYTDAEMYTRMCQEVPFLGYDSAYNVGYENGYAGNYTSTMIMVDGAACSGYPHFAMRGGQMDAVNGSDMSGFAQSPEFLQHECQTSMMHQQHLHSDFAASHPQVLQLSAAIYQQLPPPPAPPAPVDISGPPMPAPPSSSPVGEDDDYDDEEDEVATFVHGQIAPTRGSMNHGIGRCKPCAFVHTKGCGNGFECPFCHLCDPGEKKKRRKDKLEARRTFRDMRQTFSFGGPDFMRLPRGSGQVLE